MKFVCLGYMDEKVWDALSKSEQDATIEECFAYDDKLRNNGHWVDGGQALQSARTAKVLRRKDGKVLVTDGPFTETKEQLGGLGVLEARDMDHALELMSKHPGVRIGPFEIRPIDEESLSRQLAWEDSPEGRSVAAAKHGAAAETVRFACLGYIEDQNWDARPCGEMNVMLAECIAFDEARRNEGQWLSGIGLQGAGTAKTLRAKGNKVLVTDGPYAETKEWLGGVVVLGFQDLNHAIEVLSKHPCLRFGVSIEIRPIDEEINARWEARNRQANRV